MSVADPPRSIEAESAVLGCILLRPDLFDLLHGELATDDFFLPAHREVWEGMGAIWRRGMPVDVVALADELRARDMIRRLDGGEAYLITLANAVPTAENAGHYAEMVRERSSRRKLVAIAADLQTQAAAVATTDLAEVLEAVQQQLSRVVSGKAEKLTSMAALAEPVMDAIEARSNRVRSGQSSVSGAATGITALDAQTTGFQPGDVAVFAADTGGGKTALALQAAQRLCLAGGTALIFNLEMPAVQIAERAFAYRSRVDSHKLRNGMITSAEWAKLHDANRALKPLAFYVEDQAYRFAEIVAKTRRWRMRHPELRGLMVVDYLQLIHGDGGGNRARELGDMAKGFKRLAKELEVAIILVSQLNREGKASKEPPSKRHLRESGDIEDAADYILLIHNPDQFEDGTVEIILDKNRHGPCRTVRVRWVAKHFLFCDPEATWQARERGDHWTETEVEQ